MGPVRALRWTRGIRTRRLRHSGRPPPLRPAAARSPSFLRRGPFREGAFTSPLHEPRTVVVVGRWLGAALLLCFLTGLTSHLLQDPPAWLAPTCPPAR